VPSGRAALDLIPLFAAASAIRALIAAGLALRGGLAAQLIAGSALACAASNLPAAAALRPAGTAGLRAAILATAIGPGLLLTGSVATLICRRIARDAGTALSAWQFAAIGSVLVPAQLAAGSALSCVVNNLPAAAALRPSGTAGLWAAILATTIGPNLLLTGSVATLISRRIARDAGARLSAWQFTATGLALVPAQLAVAALGLHLTGTLR